MPMALTYLEASKSSENFDVCSFSDVGFFGTSDEVRPLTIAVLTSHFIRSARITSALRATNLSLLRSKALTKNTD